MDSFMFLIYILYNIKFTQVKNNLKISQKLKLIDKKNL